MKRILILLLGFVCIAGYSQKKPAAPAKPKLTYDEKLYGAMEWRSIGPYRGGRAAAVTGVPGKPTLFYFGATGGGVWRTQDGGSTWVRATVEWYLANMDWVKAITSGAYRHWVDTNYGERGAA